MALLIVDVHAHLDFPDYELDIAEVLRVNKDAGVAAVVCNGVGPESNRRVLEISKSYDIARPALGIYPTHATELSESDFFDEVDFIRKQSICAIGEVGLDYPKSADLAVFSTKKAVMKQRFEALLEAAEKKNIPVIVQQEG
jgi:TatD DNase family protein